MEALFLLLEIKVDMSGKGLLSRLHNVLPYLGVILGIIILASPVIADLIETSRSNSAISVVASEVEQIPDAEKEELLQQAQAYNAQLAATTISIEASNDEASSNTARNGEASLGTTSDDKIWPYERQLSWGSSQIMCWIEIPRIDVRLAVYHGTGEDELMVGAGHLDFTSLPVGGPSTHCALSAHSGMPTARMFDDIHDLEPGDTFTIWTLDEPLTYRVTSIETVEPEDVSSLAIVQDKDLCTLITCTPIGVNSLRLLVHAERCTYEEAAQEQPPVIYLSPRTWPLVAGLVIAGSALILTSVHALRRNRSR